MKRITPHLAIAVSVCISAAWSQVEITLDASKETRAISKYLYGKNNSTSNRVDAPTPSAVWTQIRESGATILRENSGNNSTKYNWKWKLSSSPDWYNEVVPDNWDFEAKSIQDNAPGVQAMYGFQLAGWTAKTASKNWDAWSWYTAHNKTWLNPTQNMTGTGAIPESSGANGAGGRVATKDGDINSYLERWPVDSSVKILDHWFGSGGLGLDKTKLRFWAMDNEPDIWSSTHDDIYKTQPSAEVFLKTWFEAASKARAKYPDIQIVGPIAANEWFWYQWPGKGTEVNGKTLPWLEYFIKRVAEEQKRTGVRLLDVFSIHFYPGEMSNDDVLQTHRIYFDSTYAFPKASGVKLVNGGWDAALNKEYVLQRVRKWLDQYMGSGHNVRLGITETGLETQDPAINSVWYASTLGEFMKQDVALFTPWSWRKGMWEVLHLFGRNALPNYLPSTSTQDSLVSSYATMNANKDSLVVFLVNRATTASKAISLTLQGASSRSSTVATQQLSQLPTDRETYVSHASNALKAGTATILNGKVSMTLPALSITAVTVALQTATSTANPNATPDTKKLLGYIANLPNKDSNRVISGQFLGYAFQVANKDANGLRGYDREVASVYNSTGKYVAMVGTDLAYSAGTDYKIYCQLLADYWSAGHLVTISYHIPKPTKAVADLPADSAWKAQLDSIAVRLQYLQSKGVVVLWRPFHEMNGSWFWYGQNRSSEEFKSLWKHMFQYFTAKGLNNLIWVYSPDNGPANVLADYPGDAYVDIVALDKYNGYAADLNIAHYDDMITLKKPFGLGEFSPKGASSSDPRFATPTSYNVLMNTGMKAKYPKTSFFYNWDREWGLAMNLDADKLLKDPWVITREELQWKTGSSSATASSSSSRPVSSSSMATSSSSSRPASSSSMAASSSSSRPASSSSMATPSSSMTNRTCIAFVNGVGGYGNQCYRSGLNRMNANTCYTMNPARAPAPQWINNNANDSWWWVPTSCGSVLARTQIEGPFIIGKALYKLNGARLP